MEQDQSEHTETKIELRSDPRTATVFRPVLIEAEDFAGFCLLRNLSPDGIMGQVYKAIAANTPITLEFGPSLSLAGRVKWCKDGRIGVQFNERASVAEMLAGLASGTVEGKVKRAPRLEMQCDAQLIIDDRILDAQIQDISQRGLKVQASSIKPGDEVFVQVEGLEHRKAVVRWTQGVTAGLNFLIPISFETLAHWVISANRRELSATAG